MRSLIMLSILAAGLALVAGCSGASTSSTLPPASPSGGGSDGSQQVPDLSWSIRELELGGTATPHATITVAGHTAWADGGSRWKAVIPSRLLDLDQGEDLDLIAVTDEGGRMAARIGIQVQP